MSDEQSEGIGLKIDIAEIAKGSQSRNSFALTNRFDYVLAGLERNRGKDPFAEEGELEPRLWQSFYPYIERGRPGFNVPHTVGVVEALRLILPYHPELDERTMITTAICHDSGYEDFEWPCDYSQVLQVKEEHQEKGAKLAVGLLSSQFYGEFSRGEIREIGRLVLRHDRVEDLETEMELVFAEADFLGSLAVLAAGRATFSPQEQWRYVVTNVVRRLPRFVTPEAIALARGLLYRANKELQKEGMPSLIGLTEAPMDLLRHLNSLAYPNVQRNHGPNLST